MHRSSLIDNRWQVVIINNSDSNYKNFKILFNKFGLAIGDLKNQVTYIDGKTFNKLGLCEDHIYAIEAHEIGHYILGHGAISNEININKEELEKEADFAAYNILLKIRKPVAAKLIKERYFNHYGKPIEDFTIQFSKFLKIQKYINEIKNI